MYARMINAQRVIKGLFVGLVLATLLLCNAGVARAEDIVYWAVSDVAYAYHSSPDCPSLSRSTVTSGTVEEAIAAGKAQPCQRCNWGATNTTTDATPTTTTTTTSAVVAPTITISLKSGEIARLYNPGTGEHFFTLSPAEAVNLVCTGWVFEGVGWNTPGDSDVPVHRLCNPNGGDHHFTISAAERDMLVSLGWVYEGVGWYSSPDTAAPLYRLYNPHAEIGSHHYTGSTVERDMLVSQGWQNEGIGWYAVAA